MLKQLAVAASLALTLGTSHATSPILFNLTQFNIGAVSLYTTTVSGVTMTARGFQSNGAAADLDIDWYLSTTPGMGVYSGGLDSTLVDDGEYIQFTFSKAVTLNGFNLWDGLLASNTFYLNGTATTTGGGFGVSGLSLGPLNTFTFKHSNDNFKVQSLTVTPVPEPQAIAMVLAGLGVVGLVAARRQTQA